MKKGNRSLIASVLLLLLFAGLVVFAWHRVETYLADDPSYRLLPERIAISSKPAWVPDSFVSDVLLASGLDTGGFLLDETLPPKLAQAFGAHPWVEEVLRVEIVYPSGADVQLVYRVPVALAERPEHGLFPVDRVGTLLPTDYFLSNPEVRSAYPRIRGIESMPLGNVGTPWGDPAVLAGAQLAAILDDTIRSLNIAAIRPMAEPMPTGGKRILCYLETVKGTKILWGRPDPEDPKNEPKKLRLLELAQLYGSIDNVPANFQPIDLSKE